MTTSPIWTRCRSGLDRCSCSPTIGRPREGVTFWQVSPPVALERWNRMGLGRVYVDGGALISDFLGQGLIDDLVLTKVPVLLGDGLPLFHPIPLSTRLRLEAVKTWPSGFVNLTYSRVKKGG